MSQSPLQYVTYVAMREAKDPTSTVDCADCHEPSPWARAVRVNDDWCCGPCYVRLVDQGVLDGEAA